jgi:hypothetical protein
MTKMVAVEISNGDNRIGFAHGLCGNHELILLIRIQVVDEVILDQHVVIMQRT